MAGSSDSSLPTTNAQSLLTSIYTRLARGRRVANADARTGHLDVEHDGRWISVDLPPHLLVNYAATLGDVLDPSAATSSAERREQVRAQHVVILVEEQIESDLDQSVTGIYLTRAAAGPTSLAVRRGAASAPRETGPPANQNDGGYWSSQP
jgi:hypothetical protein